MCLRVDLAQKMTDERGFAGSDFAGDDRELRAVKHAELEHGKRHAMSSAPINQIGVRQYGKWLFPEAIIRLVHSVTLSLFLFSFAPDLPQYLRQCQCNFPP